MKFPRLQFAAAAVILLGLFGRGAQPPPARTIKIVVPLAPGGGEMDVWWGVFAPAQTPKERVSQLADLFARAVQGLVALGFYPVGVCGEDFAGYMRKQYEEYGRIIREANIKSE
jgi:tripartite-type tricarboxylate transporter receptor subunit TctC